MLNLWNRATRCRRLVTAGCHALFQFDSWQRAISRSVLASNQSRGTWKSARESGNSEWDGTWRVGHGSLGRRRETHVHKGTYEESTSNRRRCLLTNVVIELFRDLVLRGIKPGFSPCRWRRRGPSCCPFERNGPTDYESCASSTRLRRD